METIVNLNMYINKVNEKEYGQYNNRNYVNTDSTRQWNAWCRYDKEGGCNRRETCKYKHMNINNKKQGKGSDEETLQLQRKVTRKADEEDNRNNETRPKQ